GGGGSDRHPRARTVRIVARRDGRAGRRRQGWMMPVRAASVLVVVVALLAVAGNWGPTGVTAGRLQNNFAASFNNLTILQQRELGRTVPPGAHLSILPTCSRRGSTPSGPGDWVCTLNVEIPQPGVVPFNN